MENALLAHIARVRLIAANAAELDLLDHAAEQLHAAWMSGDIADDFYRYRMGQIDERKYSLAFGDGVYGLNADSAEG
jgi:hypothetical protein